MAQIYLYAILFGTQIKEIILECVKKCINKKEAISYVRKWTENVIPEVDRFHFVTVIETELLNLHDGNIVRYNISLDEFYAWQTHWK